MLRVDHGHEDPVGQQAPDRIGRLAAEPDPPLAARRLGGRLVDVPDARVAEPGHRRCPVECPVRQGVALQDRFMAAGQGPDAGRGLAEDHCPNSVCTARGRRRASHPSAVFPLGILVPVLRPWAAVMSIGFHPGIALLVGLTGFTLGLVVRDLVLPSGGLDEAIFPGPV